MAIRIALVGKRTSDKTSTAFHLTREYGFKKMRLDDLLSKFIKDIYRYRKSQRLNSDAKNLWYNTIYKLDREAQIDYLLDKLNMTTRDVVVDDIRYENELVKLRKEAGFIIIRIDAPASKEVRLRGAKSVEDGSLLLREYFGSSNRYSVDYSIMNDNLEKTKISLDRIIQGLREKEPS